MLYLLYKSQENFFVKGVFYGNNQIDRHVQLYTLNFEMFDGTIYKQIGDVMKRLNNDYVKADKTILKR